jgi:transposase
MPSTRRSTRRSAHIPEPLRERMVQWVDERGMTQAQVADLVGCSRQTVSNTVRRFHDTGELADRHGGGRARVYDEDDMIILMDETLRQPFATAKRLISGMGDAVPPASERTVQRYCAELGFTWRWGSVRQAPHKGDAEKRHAWAEKYKRTLITR